ncbi:MAG: heavy metal sensor histidine kinase [Rhodoferax sp.]|nr:heavy metal sensor histidine kinase [Rhodoferax sp.]
MKASLSLTWRLTLLFVIASSTVLVGLGMVIAAAVEQHFQEQDMEVLAGKLALTRHTLELLTTIDELPHVTLMLDNALIGHHGLELLVLTPRREVLYATAGADFTPQLVIDSARLQPNRPSTWTLGARAYRGIATELPTGVSALSPLTVAVATDIAHHQAFMRAFRRTLWGFVAAAAALTGLLGWVAARRGLAPLRAMRDQAQVVTAQQLSRRLAATAVPAELAELAQSLNDMLSRLEEAFARLSSFSSDIAHELRTPVSNLMTQTQVALSRARSANDYRGILESNAEEFERLARMISDMLLLAKADNGLVLPHRETVHLAKEVRALFDYYEAVADEKGLQLVLEGEADVSADRLMLRRALANLLSNAVRHATPHSSVQVRIDATPDAVCIAIDNTGEAIQPEHLERIFDRFFRVDPSRQRSSEGTGLGLAITRSIVLAHGGSIGANCSEGITTFTIRLPRHDTAA